MKLLLPLLLCLAAACSATEDENNLENKGKQWALLVAGSSYWGNYRHQADIAHAYQILLKRKVPAANIIVMMYDDIANNPQNPLPGKLINKPDGPDVYKGVKIDYKGDDVTPQNFLNILSGNKQALKGIGSGRVIESTSSDNVFVNFADHGGSGILCFPKDNLSAKDLIDTLNALAKNKKFAKLVLYIEACEAGSMFDNLLDHNIKILASTASAPDESSWGWYCNYKNFPCLGDLYSITWMEHLDGKISPKESLADNYQIVRTLTTKSHVNLYGDFRNVLLGTKQFVGPNNEAFDDDVRNKDASEVSGVSSRDASLHWMKRMAKNAENQITKIKYTELVSEIEKKRDFIDETVDNIITKTVDGDEELKTQIINEHKQLKYDMLECHTDLYRLFSRKCFNLNQNEYVLKHFYKFANICHMGSEFKENATDAINSICNEDFLKITGTV